MSKILSHEKFFPSKSLSNISVQKSAKNLTKLSKFQLGVEKFCPTKCFVQRKIFSMKFYLVRYYLTKNYKLGMYSQNILPAICQKIQVLFQSWTNQSGGVSGEIGEMLTSMKSLHKMTSCLTHIEKHELNH